MLRITAAVASLLACVGLVIIWIGDYSNVAPHKRRPVTFVRFCSRFDGPWLRVGVLTADPQVQRSGPSTRPIVVWRSPMLFGYEDFED
jgi:hypothetical protein